jgi:hypothetical protein
MSFGSEYADVCLSHFSTPFRAYVEITTAPAYDGEEVIPVYDYTTIYGSGGSSGETSVISNIITFATGLAVADPIIVAWQIEDVGTFPSEYIKSLVARYSEPAPASTSTPTTNALKPTNVPAPSTSSSGLSTSTQVGIGVGVAAAAALVGGFLLFWCLRRRRKSATTTEPDVVVSEMEDQDYLRSQRKWYFGGRWRNEADGQTTQNELDSKAVHELPEPPAELEAHEPAVEDANVTARRSSLEGVHNDDGPREQA